MRCEIRTFIGTREYQEDSAGHCETSKGLFAVVCDGIGSCERGGDSSKLAVERFIEKFKAWQGDNYPEFIVDAATEIDREIFDKIGKGGGTTAVTAYITGDELYWLSVGDSRLYILRGGKLKQATTDHNYLYVLNLRRERNIIDEDTYNGELAKGGHLASYMGMGGIDIVDVSLQPLKLMGGDMLMLATDGLYKALDEDKLYDILLSDEDIAVMADELIKSVKNLEISLDNTTLALIEYK